ncbi:MAG: hypothetical protein AB1545_04890 [Thermodesulfobacteriota bacterium]
MKRAILIATSFLLIFEVVWRTSLVTAQPVQSGLSTAHVPQSAETLLQHLAHFIKQPDEDVVLLGEQLTGLQKDEWRIQSSKQNTDIQIYTPYILKPEHGDYRGVKFPYSAIPYNPKEVRFEFEGPNKLNRLFFALRDPSTFQLTPKLTQDILGTPTASLCDIERYLGSIPTILYTYETERFQVYISYTPPATQHLAIRTANHPEQYYGRLANHANFLAHKVVIERKVYPGRYDALARNFTINPPQTPKALLLLLKNFSDTPDIDYWTFAEKIFGLPKNQWGTYRNASTNDDQYFIPYDYVQNYHGLYGSFFSHFTLYGILRAAGYNPPPTPYSSTRFIVDNQEGFRELSLVFDDAPEPFCLTPKLTREVLGSPPGFFVDVANKRRNLSGHGMAKIHYTYETPGYEIKISYEDRVNGRLAPKEEQHPLSKDEVDQDRATLTPMEAHQSFCGDQLHIERKKFSTNYAAWARQLQVNPLRDGRELLQLLDKLGTQGINGNEFAEKLSGLSSSNWGEPFFIKDEKGQVRKRYCPSCKNAPYGILRDGGYNPASLPYSTVFWINQEGRLTGVILEFSTGETDVKITPKLTREILGEPSSIGIRKPMDYKLIVYGGSNLFGLVYNYTIGPYIMYLFFPLDSSQTQSLRSENGDSENSKSLKQHQNHDHLSALTIDITLKK